MRATVIGRGIHGISAAIKLAEENLDVVLLEKNNELLTGTSGSTHNRAHMGYHYPRSIETAKECIQGLEFFKKKYPQALFYPKEAYYLIDAKESKTSFEEFEKFCDKINIPYEIEIPDKNFLNPESVSSGFKVKEPVFDIEVLRKTLKYELKEKNVKVFRNSKVIGFENKNGSYYIIAENNKEKKEFSSDIILNATYAYSNNLLKIFGLEKYFTRYCIQKTEVPVVSSKLRLPSMTIMDGKFVSLMNLANSEYYLLYDVIHSVLQKKEEFFLEETKNNYSNLEKIVEHGKEYFPFMEELKHIKSLYGYRPIPLDVMGDSRKTRIQKYEELPRIYSILEGKFISAPLMAEKLIEILKEEGVIK